MAAAAIFNLHLVAILKHCRLHATDLNHHTKFHENVSVYYAKWPHKYIHGKIIKKDLAQSYTTNR